MMAAPTCSRQAIPGVTIVYGAAAWPSVLARTGPHATRSGPENDGTDGRVITVGDVSVQIVTMPGHTPGTISFLFEFKDKRQADQGGLRRRHRDHLQRECRVSTTILASSRKFAKAAAEYGATALMSNHTEFDNGYFKAQTAEAIAGRLGKNPGCAQSVLRRSTGGGELLGVVELCTKAAKLRATGSL